MLRMGVYHIGIGVSKLDRAIGFYRDFVGLFCLKLVKALSIRKLAEKFLSGVIA